MSYTPTHRRPTRFSLRTKVLTVVSAALLAVFGFVLSASATAKPSVGLDANGVLHVCVQMKAPHNWTANVDSANWAKNTCPSGYTQLHFAPGAGNGLKPSANTTTTLDKRTDSGNNGDWAMDTLSRVSTVVVDHAVAASTCGATATHCYFVTGTVADSGSFTTLDNAKSPQAGTAINGTVTGTIVGGSSFEFYASSNDVLANRVDPVQSGAAHSTGTWLHQFFPAGTQFASDNEPQWSWTYTASSTCETWTDAYNNSDGSLAKDGDIVGVNHC